MTIEEISTAIHARMIPGRQRPTVLSCRSRLALATRRRRSNTVTERCGAAQQRARFAHAHHLLGIVAHKGMQHGSAAVWHGLKSWRWWHGRKISRPRLGATVIIHTHRHGAIIARKGVIGVHSCRVIGGRGGSRRRPNDGGWHDHRAVRPKLNLGRRITAASATTLFLAASAIHVFVINGARAALGLHHACC